SRKPSLRSSMLRIRCESQDTEDDDDDDPSPFRRACQSRSLEDNDTQLEGPDEYVQYDEDGVLVKPNFLMLNGNSDDGRKMCRMNQERSLDLDSPSNAAHPIVE
ncbi:unnamed protein product, partial [Meganyctiphanes norvegica]